MLVKPKSKNGKTVSAKKVVKKKTVSKPKIAKQTIKKQVVLDLERHMLSLLMDNLPDNIYFKDEKSRFVRVNNNMANLFKINDPDLAIGKTDFDFFPVQHAQDAFNDEQEIVRTGMPLVGKMEKETSENQPEHWVLSTKLPIFNEKKKVIGTFGISRDITAIKTYEKELQKAKEELELRVAERTADLKHANEGLQTRISQLDFLTKISYEMAQWIEIDTLSQAIVEAFVSRLPNAIAGCCVLVAKEYECKAATGILHGSSGRAACELLADLFHAQGAKHSIICEDWATSSYKNTLNGLRLDNLPFFCFIPLLADTREIGMVFLFAPKQNNYVQEEKVLATLAAQAALSLSNAIYYKDAAEKARLQGEANAARSIQYRLVPSQTPSIPHINLKGHYSPAFEVSGDYLDYFKTERGNWVVVIADVCGKGIPAAMVMTMLRSAFRTQSEKESSAKKLLCAVNNSMRLNLDDRSFITALCCIFNPDASQMTYARAGHPCLIRLPAGNNKPEVITVRGVALGLLQDEREFAGLLEEKTISLVAGDRYLLYTDGLTEAMDSKKVIYGTPRLSQLLTGVTDTSPKGMIDAIVNDVKAFACNAPRNDDMTLITFTVTDGNDAS